MTKKLDEIPYLATHYAHQTEKGTTIEAATDTCRPRTRVLVLKQGRIVFCGSVVEFETRTLPSVVRLTHADNGALISHYETSDPWDKSRRPRERIL